MKKLKEVLSEIEDKERRESFRIDDDLSLVFYKLDKPEASADETAVPEIEALLRTPQPDNIEPAVWKLLVHLHKKLDLILERMPMDLFKIDTQPVNLSATGLRIKTRKNFELEERVKIRMLLPTLPAKEIVLKGQVVRITPNNDGIHELALRFEDVNEEIQKEIIQHTLKQQRKELSLQREPKRGK